MPVLLPVDTFARYRVDTTTGCWNWTGPFSSDGYGQITAQTDRTASGVTTFKAHVLFFVDAKCKIPNGMKLDHLCRNRRCVNPEHLEIVTNAENVRRGNSAKLTKALTAEIRDRYAQGGISQLKLAQEYGVSESSIQQIVVGRSWTADNAVNVLSIHNKPGRRSILSSQQASEIIAAIQGGAVQNDLAKRYGVSPGTISTLKRKGRNDGLNDGSSINATDTADSDNTAAEA